MKGDYKSPYILSITPSRFSNISLSENLIIWIRWVQCGPSFRRMPESSDFVLIYLMPKKGYLYILGSHRNGTLYVDVGVICMKKSSKAKVAGFRVEPGMTSKINERTNNYLSTRLPEEL